MRWVFLVAGFGAGLGVGLLFSQRETPRAVRPRAPAIEREARAPNAGEDPATRDEAPPSTYDGAAPVIEPTGDLSVEDAEDLDGHGRIEVDFDGFDGEHRAWIARTTLTGARVDDDATPDHNETVATAVVIPGVCDVWWLVGPRRVGTRARVVAGRVVRIRAADFDAALVPRDLAVLGIHVGASWGGSLPFFGITIDSDDDGLRFRTNQDGCVNVTLRPGEVTVKVGDQVTPVTLAAGRETVLEVRHQAEGDVLFDPLRAGGAARLGLRPVGGRRTGVRKRYRSLDRDGFLYVKAGEYDVCRSIGRGTAGGTVLGTVRVHPGRASVFRVVLPPGLLEIEVVLPAERARESPYVLVSLQSVHGKGVRFVDQVQGGRVALDGRYVYRVRIDGLHPGEYRVSCGTAVETVEVGAGITQVVLRPPR